MNTPLYSTLFSIREKLRQTNSTLVLGESCTSGMVAAELGQIPGISEYFCGSMVVYQSETKTAWLGIDPRGLGDPLRGPVSNWASCELARSLLSQTPKATFAAAITGHLGPCAPSNLDGRVFAALAQRNQSAPESIDWTLQTMAPRGADDWLTRRARQIEATSLFLQWIDQQLTPPR